MAKPSITDVYERLTSVETTSINQSKKMDEVHKALMGNGQPGLLSDMNQWKGGAKLFGIVISTIVGFLSVCVGALAYIK